jgi:methylated-DNA-[protein]-cysteine S-methyltransferase
MKSFRESVLSVVRKIPLGSVLSYKQVAERAGYPNAARAVGSFMKKNTDPMIPCHRVIRSDGRVGAYNRGAKKKMAILEGEGLRIQNGRLI